MSVGIGPDDAICEFCVAVDKKTNLTQIPGIGWMHEYNCDGRTPGERIRAALESAGYGERSAKVQEFQALITGSVHGALMAADHLKINVVFSVDSDGNYLPELYVTGQESGVRLRISVEPA